MNDYGRDYFTDTLNFYSENDLLYFASGTNSTQAWTPLSIETEAGKITMIGYNRMGPDGVIATESLTGTAYYTQDDFLNSLGLVPEDTDILWLDTHLWPEYGTTPTTEQITLTQEAVDNGVDLVTGVSSHEIQSITFYEDTPIFYGLGNFWFDQMWSEETRTGITLRIYAYEGKIRNIEILPTKVYDYCQPRFLEGDEKQEVLEYLIEISEF
jgi:poly-gamma-glutamate synthesis protein (capsule biosynthesis protein)